VTEILSLAQLWLATYAQVGAIVLVALALGYLPLQRLIEGPVLWPLAVIVGFGLLSLYVCLLSWFHLMAPAAILLAAVVGIGLLPIAWLRRPTWERASPKASGSRLAITLSASCWRDFCWSHPSSRSIP
jgi:hypothetical protein